MMGRKNSAVKYITVFLWVFIVSGCNDSGNNITGGFLSLSKEDTIRETVFRYQFDHNESGQQQSTGIYFISVMVRSDTADSWDYGDPSIELLTQFIGNKPPVKSFSQCVISVNGVMDINTGERGLLFRVGNIKMTGENNAEADGGYFEAGLSASGNTYYLERKAGRWYVVKAILLWIA